ncbi:MAG: TIGR02117 family protein [Desulfobulbaceae bacterium]|nr:TIGR02117 family protein [Desulfobulbaceae bacterium]
MSNAILFLICPALLLVACSDKPYAFVPAAASDPVRSQQIYIVNHGYHTGIVIPGEVLNEAVPELTERFGMPAYYEIGWGDRKFYQAQEANTSLALQALLRSGGSVLHLVAFSENPRSFFNGEPVISTCLSRNELDSLKSFLVSSFSRSSNNSITALQTGIYGNSHFYTAEGNYHLLNTCNKWTAKALKSSGFKVYPSVMLTSSIIMKYLKDNRHPCAHP